MIFTERTITVSKDTSSMSNSPIVLYRGDREVEIRFTIVENPYKYSNKDATNIIETTDASYGQLVIKVPNDRAPIFSEITQTKKGCITFTITTEMIDEVSETGEYDFQIRLFDEEKVSRITIPPVNGGISVREPIAVEAGSLPETPIVQETQEPTFTENNKYNKSVWDMSGRVTTGKMNKIEDALYQINDIARAGTNEGLISSIVVNGATYTPTNGVVNLPNFSEGGSSSGGSSDIIATDEEVNQAIDSIFGGVN